jgi:hypothetical protein
VPTMKINFSQLLSPSLFFSQLSNITSYSTESCDKLQIKLSSTDLGHLSPILDEAVKLAPISTEQLINEFASIETQPDKQASPYFWPFLCYMEYLEAACTVTYNDLYGCSNENLNHLTCPSYEGRKLLIDTNKFTTSSDGTMTMGIGLNLAYSDREAVVYKTNSSWDFSSLQTTPGIPQPVMTDIEVTDMFYYTLMGAQSKSQTYIGQLYTLKNLLGSSLASKSLQVNEIIALLSLSFNGNTLIGDDMRASLETYVNTGDNLGVLINFVEQSNKIEDTNTNAKTRVGLENRHLKEAAFFHGVLEDLRLPWLEYGKICGEVDATNYPPQYLSTHGLPKNKLESDYAGEVEIIVTEGHDSAHLDKIIYGTPSDDNLSRINPGSSESDTGHLTLFGGDGNDWLEIQDQDSYSHYHTMAGNAGYDTYSLLPGNAYQNVFIEDSDAQGELHINSTKLQGIFWSEELGQYLSIDQTRYDLFSGKNQEDQDVLQITAPQCSILINNAQADGTLGIVSADMPQYIANNQPGKLQAVISLPDNTIVSIAQESASSISQRRYTPEGELKQSAVLSPIPMECTELRFAATGQSDNTQDFFITNVQTYNQRKDKYGEKLVSSYYKADGTYYSYYPIGGQGCDESSKGPNCYYPMTRSTTIQTDNKEDLGVIVAYTRYTYSSKSGYGQNTLYFLPLNTDPLTAPAVASWSKTSNLPIDFQLAPYSNNCFVLAVLDSSPNKITCYVYNQDKTLLDTAIISENIEIKKITALSALQDQNGYFIAYTDANNQTHTRVITNSQNITEKNTLSQTIDQTSAVTALNDGTLFLGDTQQAAFIDDANTGNTFDMTSGSKDCAIQQVWSASKLTDNRMLLLASDSNNAICTIKVNTQRLHWSQKVGLFGKAANNSNNIDISKDWQQPVRSEEYQVRRV